MNLFSMLIGLTCIVAAAPAGPTLRGRVVDPMGMPVAGARVGVSTATPRVGPAMFCPSCYPDCRKSTRSDDQGRFEIADLDPSLRFRILASAPGRKARLMKLVDPLSGEIQIALETLPKELPRDRTVTAQLVDERGRGIAGALVDPVGAQTAQSRWWGQLNVDPTVSDDQGHFTLILPTGYQGIDVEVTAAGYAGAQFALLKPGPERQRLKVPEGTRVTGTLVRAGQPVAAARVAVVQSDRSAGRLFIKAVGAVTGKDGTFAFDHLPANEEYAIFTTVGAGPQRFVLSTKRFTAHGDNQERDLGALEMIPAKQLAGRIEVPAGQALPPNAKITLGRDPAWDLIAVPVDKDGRFIVDGLSPETYEVRVIAKGLEIDNRQLPYQMLRGGTFGLRLRDSVDDLRIPMIPSGSPPSER